MATQSKYHKSVWSLVPSENKTSIYSSIIPFWWTHRVTLTPTISHPQCHNDNTLGVYLLVSHTEKIILIIFILKYEVHLWYFFIKWNHSFSVALYCFSIYISFYFSKIICNHLLMLTHYQFAPLYHPFDIPGD